MLRAKLRTLHTDMTLREYLDSLPKGGTAALASQLGISTVYLLQLAARQDEREPKPALAVAIEQATGRAVQRRDLRPNDWRDIWPELVGTKGAPRVPVRKAA